MRRPPYRWFAIGAIIVVAAALRLYRLDAHSFWIDEIYTTLSVSGHGFRDYKTLPSDVWIDRPIALTDRATAKPWYATLRPDRDDIHPPTFFFLARVWVSLFGWDGWKLRLLAAIPATAAVGLLYAAVREWNGTAAGLGAAAIMAVAQPQIWMAQEARAYTLVLAVSLGAAWALARIERRGVNGRRVAALATLCLLLPMLHYFSLAVVATLALYATIRLRGRSRNAALAATVGAALLFAICWSPVLYRQAHGASGSGTGVFVDASEHHFRTTFFRLAMVPTRSLYDPLPSERPVALVLSAVCVLPWLLIRRRPDLLIWLIWLPMNVAPSLLNDLAHKSWTLEIERYTLPATLAVYALLAGIGTLAAKNRLMILPLLAVAGAAVHLDQTYNLQERKASQKWREFAALYETMARPGDLTIFADSRDPEHAYDFLLCTEHYAHPLPGPVVILTRAASPELLERIKTHAAVFVGDADAKKCLPGVEGGELHFIPFLGTVSRLKTPIDR